MDNKETTEKKERRQQYWFVIRELTSREIKRKYARSKLGIIWSVLNPLLTMAVLSLIFSKMFSRSIENYPIYYLCGYILWQLFTGATNSAMSTLVDNKNMLIKVKFPMRIFVLSRVYTAFVNFLYSLIGFAIMICVFRVWPNWTIVFAPVIVFFLVLFALGISYIMSTAYVFFGDVKHLYSVLLTLWMYLSAIFYPVDQLGGFIENIIRANPIFNYIDCMRCVVLYGTIPSLFEIIRIAIWGVAVYFIGRRVFNANKNRIMQKL